MAKYFDRKKYPSSPRGAAFRKGDNVFKQRTRFWQEAENAIIAFEGASGVAFAEDFRPLGCVELWEKACEAIQKFDCHCDAMNEFFGMLSRAMEEGDKAVRAAGLEADSPEGVELYNRIRRQYEQDHKISFPE